MSQKQWLTHAVGVAKAARKETQRMNVKRIQDMLTELSGTDGFSEHSKEWEALIKQLENMEKLQRMADRCASIMESRENNRKLLQKIDRDFDKWIDQQSERWEEEAERRAVIHDLS